MLVSGLIDYNMKLVNYLVNYGLLNFQKDYNLGCALQCDCSHLAMNALTGWHGGGVVSAVAVKEGSAGV